MSKISVCMATYNGEKYIKEQIDSILCQLSEGDELIISDDGSKDSTTDIIESYNDSRIKLYIHKKKSIHRRYITNSYRVALNFENALINATGDYIFLSDQDDIWLPGKVGKSIKALENSDNGILLVSKARHINNDGDTIGGNRVLKKKYNFIDVSINGPFSGCTMCMKKELISMALPYPKYIETHDTWFVLVAIKSKRLVILDEQLILYRKHGGNVTKTAQNPLWYKIYFRLMFMFEYLRF